jgi:glycosyltransferase involved in cell wall biosynthesis
MHPHMGEGVVGANNVDVALHSDIVPVHEYLPVAGARQQAVSTMTPVQALRYTADIAAALSMLGHVDVVVAHHANLTAVAAQYFAHRMRIPYVVFVHGTGIEPRHDGGYDSAVWEEIRDAIEGAAGIIVTTDYVRDELVRPVADIPVGRFFVLPCGVDLDEFHPDNRSDVRERYGLPERYVICPGALTKLKGPQNVVAASREYADLAETMFIGDGDLRQELEHDLGDRGRVLGFVSDADKAALINGATVLAAAPEKREHFGIIYVEALAAGTVPVAYSGGGVNSIISRDVGVTTERDPRALGRAIRRILHDDEQRSNMARAGRERAVRLYDDAALGSELEAWLTAIARHDPRLRMGEHPVFGGVAS